MAQNIQYLYEYQNGKRVRNIGFMKIEMQMDKCVIQIHAKQIDDVKGILFQKANGETYVGGWEAEMLPIERAVFVDKQMPVEERMPVQQEQATPQFQSAQPTNERTVPEAPMEPQEIEEYIIPSNTTYEKIQRQDISRLPRKEWRLANNSFLLHGVHNYHHLLYIEEDGTIWIGVPGIYHEKEKTAANAFGFTNFRRLADVNIDLKENEKNTYEDFGYWCRRISI